MSGVIVTALAHSLWQAMLVAGCLSIMRLLLGQRTAWRYYLSVAALLLMFTLPLVTAISMASHHTPLVASRIPHFGVELAGIYVPSSATFTREALRIEEGMESLRGYLLYAWMIGVSVMLARLALGIRAAENLVTRNTTPPTRDLAAMCNVLACKLGISRPVKLLISHLTDVPSVVGCVKPVILLPAALLVQLPVDQLEAILLHELSHVRRYDYLVNLLQCAVESLLFFNPFVWWVSSLVRQDREHISDDDAVRITGNRISYSRALIAAEKLRSQPQHSVALAATGADLRSRVRRLVQPVAFRPAELFSGLLLTSLACSGLFVLALRAQVSPPSPDAFQRIVDSLRGSDWVMTAEIKSNLDALRSRPIEPVIQNLRHPDRRIRERTAWILGNLGNPASVQPLADALEDVSPRVAHTAAWALGRIGDRSVTNSLIRALNTASPDARAGAAWALGNLHAKSGVSALIQLLPDASSDVRCAAAWALGQIGDERAKPALLAMLRDAREDARAKAEQALTRLGSR